MNETSGSVKGRRSRRPHVKRPLLTRAQPIRSFAGIFGASEPQGQGPNHRTPEAAPPKPNEKAATGKESVRRGVNAGYRVIEEYLRQGEEVARALWPGARTGATQGVEPMNMTERLVRSASDFAGLFSEFLQTFSLPGTLPPPGSQPIPAFGIGGSEKAASTTQAAQAPEKDERPSLVSVDVKSKRRTEVTLELKPRAWATNLVVHDLRSASATVPRLHGITATYLPAERRVVLRVRIPDRQPVGTYSGLVVDQGTNIPQGTLSVRILASDKEK